LEARRERETKEKRREEKKHQKQYRVCLSILPGIIEKFFG